MRCYGGSFFVLGVALVTVLLIAPEVLGLIHSVHAINHALAR